MTWSKVNHCDGISRLRNIAYRSSAFENCEWHQDLENDDTVANDKPCPGTVMVGSGRTLTPLSMAMEDTVHPSERQTIMIRMATTMASDMALLQFPQTPLLQPETNTLVLEERPRARRRRR
jgi:hypothetical protein